MRIIGRLVGGPARQACLLHEELTPEFQTLLVAGTPCPGEHDMGYLLGSEDRVFRLSEMSREVSWWADVKAFFRIVRLLRRERPDVVHTHTAKAGALGRAAAWLSRVPVVVHTYHGHIFHGYFSPAKVRIYLALERMLARMSNRIIAISESQREELAVKYRVAPRTKISVVKNGFHLDDFSAQERAEARLKFGFGDADFVLVWAARMAPVKDLKLLAEVVRLAGTVCPQARFLVVGDGEEKQEFESLVQGCSTVQMLGWQRDMQQIWRAANAAILTSRNEGTPTALIEAMAAGLPFVSTNVGGVTDLSGGSCRPLPDGLGLQAANGFLTVRSAGALVYAISQLIGVPEVSKEMGNSGKRFVHERFNSRRLVADIASFYQELLRSKGATPSAQEVKVRKVSASS